MADLSTTFDADLRRLERACSTDPSDPALGRRYARSLVRAGLHGQAAAVLYEIGDRVAQCEAFAIRWEADLAKLRLPKLAQRRRHLRRPAINSIVEDDLRHFDPELLAKHWPRRKDGEYRLNTTLFLRRFPLCELESPHRKLILVAFTPGTATLWDRPEDRGKHLITVALETRSTHKKPLPPRQWRWAGRATPQ
jgi:hypothetical protein